MRVYKNVPLHTCRLTCWGGPEPLGESGTSARAGRGGGCWQSSEREHHRGGHISLGRRGGARLQPALQGALCGCGARTSRRRGHAQLQLETQAPVQRVKNSSSSNTAATLLPAKKHATVIITCLTSCYFLDHNTSKFKDKGKQRVGYHLLVCKISWDIYCTVYSLYELEL